MMIYSILANQHLNYKKLNIEVNSVLSSSNILYVFTIIYSFLILLYIFNIRISYIPNIIYILFVLHGIILLLFYTLNLKTYMIYAKFYEYNIYIPNKYYVEYDVNCADAEALILLLSKNIGNIIYLQTPLISSLTNNINKTNINITRDIYSIYILLQLSPEYKLIQFFTNVYTIIDICIQITMMIFIYMIIKHNDNIKSYYYIAIAICCFIFAQIMRDAFVEYVHKIANKNLIYNLIYKILQKDNIKDIYAEFKMPKLYI